MEKETQMWSFPECEHEIFSYGTIKIDADNYTLFAIAFQLDARKLIHERNNKNQNLEFIQQYESNEIIT